MYSNSTIGYKRRDYASGRSQYAPDAARGYRAAGGGTTIYHREFIQNIVTPSPAVPTTGGPFTIIIDRQAINPGNEIIFPWMSQVAQNYIQWKAMDITFHYVSTSGELNGSSSNALGSVNMAVQYDSLLPSYTNKPEMLMEQGAVSGVPSRDLRLKCKVTPNSVLKRQYIRGAFAPNSGTGPAVIDPLMFDLGNFTLAVDGFPQPNVTLGELYVEYTIHVYKPSLENSALGTTTGNGVARWTLSPTVNDYLATATSSGQWTTANAWAPQTVANTKVEIKTGSYSGAIITPWRTTGSPTGGPGGNGLLFQPGTVTANQVTQVCVFVYNPSPDTETLKWADTDFANWSPVNFYPINCTVLEWTNCHGSNATVQTQAVYINSFTIMLQPIDFTKPYGFLPNTSGGTAGLPPLLPRASIAPNTVEIVCCSVPSALFYQ